MRVRVVWWDLDGSATTIAALREYLRDESAFSEAPLGRRGAAFAAS